MKGIKREKGALKAAFKTRNFKAGSMSLAVCAVVVVIAVLVNMIVSTLPSKWTDLDISGTDLYTLGEYSKQIAREVDGDVTIYHLTTESEKDTTLSTLLARYADLNSHIKVEVRDPEISQIASQYTDDALSANSLIFVSDKRSKVVDYADIYQYSEQAQMYAYYGQSVSPDIFDGEGQITSALNYVTTDVLPKIYALTGHGEYTLGTTVQSAIASENIELCELDLVMEKTVPEDCACLLILGPNVDISDSERTAILTYLEGGGRLLACAIPAMDQKAATPNFDKLLAAYGVETSDGFVVEGDTSSYYQYPNYLVPTLNSHEITDPLIENNYHVFMPLVQSISAVKTIRSTLEVTSLMTTSDSAFSRTDLTNNSAEKAEGDTDGPFDVAFAVTEQVKDGETRAVILGTPYFLDDNFILYAGNSNLLLNSLKWMCDLEENISVVESKALSGGGSLEMTDSGTSLWSFGITVILPLVLIIVGIVIFVRRKKR